MTMMMLLIGCWAADPLLLENGRVRVELDPALATVVYAGIPGKLNWIGPPEAPMGTSPDDQKPAFTGFVSELVAQNGQDMGFQPGPVEIVSQTPLQTVFLGPVSAKYPVRLKTEIQLADTGGKITYTVTAVATDTVPGVFALRNTVRLPQNTTLRINTGDGMFRPLSGAKTIFPVVSKSFGYWLLTVPTAGLYKNLVLGAHVTQVSLHNSANIWTRFPRETFDGVRKYLDDSNILCRINDETREYRVTLQSPLGEIRADAPLAFQEEWSIEYMSR